jgi:hypothetical protein
MLTPLFFLGLLFFGMFCSCQTKCTISLCHKVIYVALILLACNAYIEPGRVKHRWIVLDGRIIVYRPRVGILLLLVSLLNSSFLQAEIMNQQSLVNLAVL